jgi:hypothetical protein
MRNYTLLFVIISFFLFSSCSKDIDDRIIGSWQLENAWKQKLFNRDYFQTGYENGIFTFSENGNATYIDGSDTLTGYWRSDRQNRRYYNSGSGEWETRYMWYLHISLVNFQQNKRLEWEFDDFHFRNDWRTIRAEQYWYSNDRVYEFRRR